MGIPGSSFFGWEEGAIKDAAIEALTRHGGDYTAALQDIRIGGLEKGYGANDENVRKFLINQQRNAINSNPQLQRLALEADAPLYSSGGFANQGDSLMQTQSKLKGLIDGKTETERQRKRTETKEDNTTALNNSLTLGKQGIDANAAAGRLALEAEGKRFEHAERNSSARYAHERGESKMNNRHERELAMLSGDRQMAIAEMQEGLQDRRMDFDRETRRMDKRDRMIAQLMSGLGGLGAAFG